MPEAFRVTTKPIDGPRRRVTYRPASHVTDRMEHSWWQIEEVYETDKHGRWRETGRELVSEPALVVGDVEAVEVPEDA